MRSPTTIYFSSKMLTIFVTNDNIYSTQLLIDISNQNVDGNRSFWHIIQSELEYSRLMKW